MTMQDNLAPELLSPAGNWECARAAVANGADAIFFGMPRFNARMRADNITEEDPAHAQADGIPLSAFLRNLRGNLNRILYLPSVVFCIF